ncbi:hypothetical protein HELRODRAFT_184635, partial [Helobdella robusta]|uniref:Endonuclease/exonuclease/phosphatase domain-containing protein n=1 Tax=Helobdella robusta TaxID=6412 RepID=T1FLM8_HELRO
LLKFSAVIAQVSHPYNGQLLTYALYSLHFIYDGISIEHNTEGIRIIADIRGADTLNYKKGEKKRVQRISGDPVHGVAVQGPVDGLATGTPLYSVAVQGTMNGRITCRPRGWRFGTWNVGTLTGRSLEVVEELQRGMVDVAALQEIRWKGEGTRFVGAKGGRHKLWWKGDDGTGGVGVMVREELVEKVLEVRRTSNGVIVMVMVFGK